MYNQFIISQATDFFYIKSLIFYIFNSVLNAFFA